MEYIIKQWTRGYVIAAESFALNKASGALCALCESDLDGFGDEEIDRELKYIGDHHRIVEASGFRFNVIEYSDESLYYIQLKNRTLSATIAECIAEIKKSSSAEFENELKRYESLREQDLWVPAKNLLQELSARVAPYGELVSRDTLIAVFGRIMVDGFIAAYRDSRDQIPSAAEISRCCDKVIIRLSYKC